MTNAAVNLLEIEQYLRYHMVDASFKERVAKPDKPRRQRTSHYPSALERRIEEVGRPYGSFCLIFDTETKEFDGQKLRFGVYQIRGIAPEIRLALAKANKLTRDALDTLQEHGIFYDASTLTEDEISLLHSYAASHNLKIMTRLEFSRDVLVGTGRYWKDYHRHGLLIIGFNLPFDISAVAFNFWMARKEFYGGFGFKLCDCGDDADKKRKRCAFHPGIKIKPIAPRKQIFDWCVEMIPEQAISSEISRKKNSAYGRVNKRKAQFLDAGQLARALLGPEGTGSLETLCRTLNVTTLKKSQEDHGGPLTIEYVDYAIGDVQSTWEVFTKLRDLYRRHNISKPIWKIYSEASLGKGYFSDLGIPKFMDQHENVSPEIIGKFMSAYYGGRSEVRIRLSPREIIHCDFKSQYPTVNAIMDLQSLLLAEKVDIRVNAPEALIFLKGVTLSDLQKRETWRSLRGIAKIRPAKDILPVRAIYTKSGSATNIALCNVIEGLPVYYTFADIVASKLLTGKLPEILETIELVPQGSVTVKTKTLFDDDRYEIDPARDDLFARIIDMRSEIKEQAKAASKKEREYYHSLQLALKLLANATSYGTLIEVVDHERYEFRSVDVFRADKEEGERHRTQKVETPGPYFAGPVGVLIPAAGRLLLAIAERLGLDHGIQHVFYDTDSICYARPDDIEFNEFASRVRSIVDWFTPLSPYRGTSPEQPPPILNIEVGITDQGYNDPGWHCMAVSAKRYAIYRHGDHARGEARIIFKKAKLSSHGMGAIRDPAGYQSNFSDAPPIEELRKLVTSKSAATVIYDLWRTTIQCIEDSKPISRIRPHLRYRYSVQATIGNAHQARLYDMVENLRPFMFFSAVPSMRRDHLTVGDLKDGNVPEEMRDRVLMLQAETFYGPFSKSFEETARDLHFRRDGLPLTITDADLKYLRFTTIEDRLADYFEHPESKAFPLCGKGLIDRHNVKIIGHLWSGKETHDFQELQEYSDSDLDLEPHRPGLVLGGSKQVIVRNARISPEVFKALNVVGVRELERRTGIRNEAISRFRRGETVPDNDKSALILAAYDAFKKEGDTDEKIEGKAEQLRKRIKRLQGGDEISGFARVMKAVMPAMSRYKFLQFYIHEKAPSPDDLDLIRETVETFERADYPVGPASIRGTITRVIWSDPHEDFCRFKMTAAKNEDEEISVLVQGTLFDAGPGLTVYIEGKWEYDPERGHLIAAESITPELPADEEWIQAYLGSGVIEGIGKRLASSIVRKFGSNVWNVIREEPERLKEVQGMTSDAAEKLALLCDPDARQRLAAEIEASFGNTFEGTFGAMSFAMFETAN